MIPWRLGGHRIHEATVPPSKLRNTDVCTHRSGTRDSSDPYPLSLPCRRVIARAWRESAARSNSIHSSWIRSHCSRSYMPDRLPSGFTIRAGREQREGLDTNGQERGLRNKRLGRKHHRKVFRDGRQNHAAGTCLFSIASLKINCKMSLGDFTRNLPGLLFVSSGQPKPATRCVKGVTVCM